MIDTEIPKTLEPSAPAPEKPVSTIKLSTNIIPLRHETDDNSTYIELEKRDASQEERQRFIRDLEGARALGEMKTRFWNMLVQSVAKTGYTPPQDRPTEILDLACGKCNEALVLDEFFGGGKFGSPTNRVKITGVDIKQEDIDAAIKRHQRPNFTEPITTYNLPENYQFIQGDATNLDEYPQVPKQADVVMIRHQQISDNKEVWGKIFKQGLNRVRPEGIMLITSFSDIEHLKMLEELQRLDCNVVLNEKNPWAEQTSVSKVSIDRNLAIIKRKAEPLVNKI